MDRKQRHLVLGLVLVAAVLAARYVLVSGVGVPEAEYLRAWVQGYGLLGPLLLMAVQVVHVVVAPLPNQAAAVAAGALYGVALGTLFTAAATVLGSYIAFLLGRRFGRPALQAFADDEQVERFDEVTDRHGPAATVALFLLPAFPGDLLCYAAGMSRMRSRLFLVLVVLGRTPKFLLYTAVGDRIVTEGFRAAAPFLLPLALLAVVTVLGRDQLDRFLDWLDSVTGEWLTSDGT